MTRIGLAGQVEVVGEPPLAGQQPLIFLAADRLADRAKRGTASMSITSFIPASASMLVLEQSECNRADRAQRNRRGDRSITEK